MTIVMTMVLVSKNNTNLFPTKAIYATNAGDKSAIGKQASPRNETVVVVGDEQITSKTIRNGAQP